MKMLQKGVIWRTRFGLVLIIAVSGFISTCLLYQKNNGREELVNHINRRLQNGDPSGSGLRTRGMRTDITLGTVVEEKDIVGHEKDIKISVTLASRGKKPRLSKRIKNANQLELYKERKLRISSTCRKYGLGKFPQGVETEEEESLNFQQMEDSYPWPPEKSLMHQEPWHLLYCWIHKVASSSWSKVFFNLKGKDVPPSRLHEAAQQFSVSSSKLPGAISNSLVFMIVRHPFERLVSAYRDKFELAKKYAYVYSMYTSKILGLRTSAEAEGARRPTFSEFVDYLLRVPVQQFNDHWVPYWLHCHVCEMEYDIIGKMETIEDDMEFIADRSGLAATNMSLPWTNRRNSGDKVSLQYFSNLTVNQVLGLYRIYKLDFEMFSYRVEPYFALFSDSAP